MNWLSEVERRFSRSGHAADPDVVLELAQHAQAAYETARADGVTPADATTRVQQYLDLWCADPARLRPRPVRHPIVDPPPAGSRGWTGFWHDVTYGIRLMRRQPGFALVATLLVAIG